MMVTAGTQTFVIHSHPIVLGLDRREGSPAITPICLPPAAGGMNPSLASDHVRSSLSAATPSSAAAAGGLRSGGGAGVRGAAAG